MDDESWQALCAALKAAGATSTLTDGDIAILANPDCGFADMAYALHLHTLYRAILNASEAQRAAIADRLRAYNGQARGLTPLQDASAMRRLASYLLHKGCAIEHRLNGHTDAALASESKADATYDRLADWVRW